MTTTTFDAAAYKRTTRAQWEDAAEAWHRWGPTIEDWLGAATRACSTWPASSRRARPRRRRRRRRPDAARPPGGSGPAATCSRPTSRRRSSSTPRAAATRPGSTTSRRARPTASDLDVEPGRLRRRDLARRPHLLPRPAGRAARHVRRAPPGRPALLGRLLHRRPQRLLLRPGRHHPPPRPAAPARARDSPDRSASAGPASPRRPTDAPASATSPSTSSPSPVRIASAAECLRFEQESFGALHQMLARVEPRPGATRRGPRSARPCRQFEGPDGFVGPCEMLVVTGTR